MKQRCSGASLIDRHRGSMAIGTAVIMLIVLTLSMGLLSRCAQNLALTGEKIHYFSERNFLESAEVFVQIKLEDFLEGAVRAAAGEWQTRFSGDSIEQSDTKESIEQAKVFEHQLNVSLQEKSLFLKENFIDENFGGLDYEIKQYKYRSDWHKVFLEIEIRNLAGRYQRSRFVTQYTMDIAMPEQEAVKYLRENKIDELVQAYKKNIRQELRYGRE